jgi:hypothetical protein
VRALCITLAVVLVIGCGTAYWLHWWRISTVPSNDNSKTEVRLTVDKDKMTEDVNAAKGTIKDDVQGLKEKTHEKRKTPSSGQSVEGTIHTLDPSNLKLTVMSDMNEEVRVRTETATRIRVGDKEGTLADLKIGDAVIVTYELDKGEKVAKTITVKKRS